MSYRVVQHHYCAVPNIRQLQITNSTLVKRTDLRLLRPFFFKKSGIHVVFCAKDKKVIRSAFEAI